MSQKRRSKDKPTAFAHPGWRVAYTFVSTCILGITLSGGNALFVGLMMLSWGMLVDYSKFTPTTKGRRVAKIAGCGWSGFIVATCIIAIVGAVTVKPSGATDVLYLEVVNFPFLQGSGFPVRWYWAVTSLVFMSLTVADWVTEKREDEIEAVNELQRKHAKNQTRQTRAQAAATSAASNK